MYSSTGIDILGNIVKHPIPLQGFDIEGMALSASGGLWFTNMQTQKLGYFGPDDPRPLPVSRPLSLDGRQIVATWRAHLQPRSGYDMRGVTADTLTVAGNFAVVGWSDFDGDAATLLRKYRGHWHSVFVTNGRFYQARDLTDHGVPVSTASQLLKDSNVRLIPTKIWR